MRLLYTIVTCMVIFGSWFNLVLAENVEFPDVNLANTVREVLNLPAEAAIPKAQLATLTVLYASVGDISNLTGLEHATQLTMLDIRSNQISDISPLAGLINLTDLNLTSNQISDIGPLARLANLTDLNLSSNQIRDIRPLAGLTNLTGLELDSNQIRDINPFAELTNLIVLDLAGNQISNISPLVGLTQLTSLDLAGNQISDISPLTGLTKLEFLYLGGNPITDTSPLHLIVDQNPNLQNIDIDMERISFVAFSPNGTLLASGSGDGTVKLWDMTTRETIATLEGYYSSFSPDGNLFAFVSEVNIVNLWDVGSRATIATLEGHRGGVQSVSFSPDGDLLASASLNSLNDSTVKLWDVATGKTITTLEGHVDLAFTAFSPDANLLAYSSFNGMRLWDVARQETITTFTGDVWSVTFSLDGSLLAYLENSESFPHEITSTVRLWDVAQQKTIANVGEHIGILTSLLGDSVWFLPNGDLLAYLSPDGIKLWDVASAIIPSEPEKIAADVNGDGVVNIQDLVLVILSLGRTGQSSADVNADSFVGITDLVMVAGALYTAAAAPSLHPQALVMFTAADVQQWLSQAEQLDLTDATSQRGIHFLEQLLAALIPQETALLPNYPNPFNPETWIPYQLAKPADFTLTIYTVNGRVVRQLSLGHQLAGTYQSKSRAAYWDGRNAVGESVTSGLYFYTLTAGEFTATRRMLILK